MGLRIGSVIESRWEVIRQFEAGLSDVYLIFDRDECMPWVAKSYPDGLRNEAKAKRDFLHEANILATIPLHPNVVPIFTIQSLEGRAGKPYVVMPYFPQGDLGGLIGKARLKENPALIVALSLMIADGVRHANASGVDAHMDLKPANVFLTRELLAAVGDFGISKSIGFRRASERIGTPEYIPPEQWEGAGSVQGDIYSFGGCVHAMLTGHPPFGWRTRPDGEDIRERQQTDLIGNVSADPSLDSLVRRCLELKPENRFNDFDELCSELLALFSVYHGRDYPKAPVLLDTASSISQVGICLEEIGKHEEALKHYDEAIAKDPTYSAAFANKAGLLIKLGQIDDALVAANSALELDPGKPIFWEVKGSALDAKGFSDDAIQCFEESIRLDPRSAKAWYHLGVAHGSAGRSEDAKLYYGKAIALEPDHDMALTNLGSIFINENKLEDGIDLLERALAVNSRLDEALFNIARAHRLNNCPEKALPYIVRACELNPDKQNRKALQLVKTALAIKKDYGRQVTVVYENGFDK
jgi:serine/threonine protein kinase